MDLIFFDTMIIYRFNLMKQIKCFVCQFPFVRNRKYELITPIKNKIIKKSMPYCSIGWILDLFI